MCGCWLTWFCSFPKLERTLMRLIANTDCGARLDFPSDCPSGGADRPSIRSGIFAYARIAHGLLCRHTMDGYSGRSRRVGDRHYNSFRSLFSLTASFRMDYGFCDTDVRMELPASHSPSKFDILDGISDGASWSLGHPRGRCRACLFNFRDSV